MSADEVFDVEAECPEWAAQPRAVRARHGHATAGHVRPDGRPVVTAPTVEIQLTRGMVAVVDAGDAEMVLSFGKWHAHPGRQGTFYAVRRTGGPRRGYLMMHGLLIQSDFVDHKDGDGLNNRRSNLRPADRKLNGRNRAIGSNNTSGFKGVHLVRASQLWRASIFIDGHHVSLGDFPDPAVAARAYDTAAVEAWGEFACLNFPIPGYRSARPAASDTPEVTL